MPAGCGSGCRAISPNFQALEEIRVTRYEEEVGYSLTSGELDLLNLVPVP